MSAKNNETNFFLRVNTIKKIISLILKLIPLLFYIYIYYRQKYYAIHKLKVILHFLSEFQESNNLSLDIIPCDNSTCVIACVRGINLKKKMN